MARLITVHSSPWPAEAARATVQGALALTLCGLLAPGLAVAQPASSPDVLEFRTHLRKASGVVRCGLFRRAGWLTRPAAVAVATVVGHAALCVFRGVPKGSYALSAFHDQNENGKLDTNFMGLPIEDYGTSRNARGTFGPPSFDDAKFTYRGGRQRLEAELK
jgi:uncharacterized protein (DUF2141 family)